jgi:hypothetical protein
MLHAERSMQATPWLFDNVVEQRLPTNIGQHYLF